MQKIEAIKTRYLIPAWELKQEAIREREKLVIQTLHNEYARHFMTEQKEVVRQLTCKDLGWTSWETPVIPKEQVRWSGHINEVVIGITSIIQLTPWPWHTGELEVWVGAARTYFVDLAILQLSFKKVFADMLASEMGLDIAMLIAGDNKYAQFLEMFSNLRCEGFFSTPIILEPFHAFSLNLHSSPQAKGEGTDVLMLRGYVAEQPGRIVGDYSRMIVGDY